MHEKNREKQAQSHGEHPMVCRAKRAGKGSIAGSPRRSKARLRRKQWPRSSLKPARTTLAGKAVANMLWLELILTDGF
jgi:hypothetical protein